MVSVAAAHWSIDRLSGRLSLKVTANFGRGFRQLAGGLRLERSRLGLFAILATRVPAPLLPRIDFAGLSRPDFSFCRCDAAHGDRTRSRLPVVAGGTPQDFMSCSTSTVRSESGGTSGILPVRTLIRPVALNQPSVNGAKRRKYHRDARDFDCGERMCMTLYRFR